MIAIKEWKWEKVKAKEKKEVTLYCPYCATRVRAESDTRIFDVESGSIKYHIHKCPECFMPITHYYRIGWQYNSAITVSSIQ